MKIRPVPAELFHADMTKLRVAFRNFADAPKKCSAKDHFRANRRSDSPTLLKWVQQVSFD